MPDLPDDPVLRDILAGSGIQDCLRSGCGAGGAPALALFIAQHFPRLSQQGQNWLVDSITAARTAGREIADPVRLDPLPLDSLPVIPTAVPVAAGDATVVIGGTAPIGPDNDTGREGVATVHYTAAPETLSEWLQRELERAEALAEEGYEDAAQRIEDAARRVAETGFGSIAFAYRTQ